MTLLAASEDGTYDTYYTFGFSYEFEAHEDDEVYFAHAYPYTYTDMNKNLSELREKHEGTLRMEILALSLGRLQIPMMTISENVDTYMDYAEEMRLYNKMPTSIRRQLRMLYKSVYQLALQSKQLKGDSQKMLASIISQEATKFFEQHKHELL